MMIIGCDFHPSWQQVCWLDTATGESGEQKLVQASGDAERFYRQVAAPALMGMEATGNCHWLVDLLAEIGHELWVGDAAAASICIAVTRSRKPWPEWRRRVSWPYDSTGCCARWRIQRSFASRAARGCPWSAQARP
jgi:hypothetical protein